MDRDPGVGGKIGKGSFPLAIPTASLRHNGLINCSCSTRKPHFIKTSTMKVFPVSIFVTLALSLPQFSSGKPHPKNDFAQACYGIPLPDLAPSLPNRSIPWGHPTISTSTLTCCSSLDEVRARIDAIDTQLLELLSQRAAFVREATRFKAMRDLVDVPSRDQQVIDQTVSNATGVHLPQTIARAVFTAIINSSVPFELCIFDSFHDRGH